MSVASSQTRTDERLTLGNAVLTSLALGAAAGALAGVLASGVLGRLAMRLLAVTSHPDAQGRITDDQAVVGVISLAGTVNLVLFGFVAGGIGGLVYLLARRILPPSRRARTVVHAAFTGVVGGAILVHDHPSFDFTVLQPVWLAVALFVALPTVYGAVTAALTERWHARPTDRRPPVWALVVGGIALVVDVVVAVPAMVLALVVVQVPALRRLWRSPAVSVLGWTVLAVTFAWGCYGLVADIASLVAGRPSTLPLNP